MHVVFSLHHSQSVLHPKLSGGELKNTNVDDLLCSFLQKGNADFPDMLSTKMFSGKGQFFICEISK